MKTICITCFHSIISRNILQTEILSTLTKRNMRVVLLVPEDKEEYFINSYGSLVHAVVGINTSNKKGTELMRLVSISTISIENLYIRRIVSQKQYGKMAVAYLSYYILGKFILFKKLLRFLDKHFLMNDIFYSVLEEIKPNLVFATDVYLRSDIDALRAAQNMNIKTVGMVRSWDNVTTKGVLMENPDCLLVHNNILRDELWKYNRVPKEKIEVVGIPHYDTYGASCNISRESFCASLGLDPAKKIVLFAPGGKILYRDDLLLLKTFRSLLNQKKIDPNIQFLVRIPPSDTIDRNGFESDHLFIFDTPGVQVARGKKNTEFSTQDEEHLRDSLHHSDVLVTLVSTMVIDASVFNLPTIILGFNPENNADDIRKFSTYSHFKKLIAKGLCSVAYSEREFSEMLDMYLTDKTLHADKRCEIVSRYCNGARQNSGRKVANLLVNFMGTV